jgi:eukaryotic-like serine/threonine-protein kinase
MSLATGTRLGSYEVLGKLGEGGMGEVYRARDTALDRDVAVKILPAAFASDADRVMRFEREAKTLAALNHPGIAQIYGLAELPVGESAGSSRALVMELVEGEDLSERIARGAIPPEDAVPIAAQIAEALEAAHDAGITHRDLKPANIKVRPEGTVKVLDFGLAKPPAPAGAASGSVDAMHSPTMTSPALTMQGVILGTAAYMAPEQAKGKPVDRRADIWAFGCVLYEMLTGRRLFHGEDVSDTMVAILRDEPDWQALPPGTPARVRRLLRQCLQKDPRKRLPHIGVARLDLAADADDEPAATTPAQARAWASRVPWAVAGAAAVALVAVPLWPRAPEPAPAPSVRFTIEPPRGGAFVGAAGVPRFAISPDGTALAYQVALQDRTSRLLVRRFDTLDSRALEGTGSDAGGNRGQQPFWSADGRELAFFDEVDGALLKLALETGDIRTIARMPGNQYGGSWADDGSILFSTNQTGGIRRVPAAGGDVQQVTTVDPADPADQHLWPEMFPDGRHFLFLRSRRSTGSLNVAETGSAAVYIGSLDGGAPKRVVDSPVQARFAPPDRLLFVRDGSLYSQRFDPARLELTGQPELLVNDVHYTLAGRLAASVSRTGVLVYSAGDAGGVSGETVWLDRRGDPVPGRPVLPDATNVRLSPDGRLLAFERGPGRTRHLWIREIARGVETRLGEMADTRAMAFTREGARIAYPVVGEGGLVWQPVSGGTPPEPLLASAGTQVLIPHDWTADGRLVHTAAITDPGVYLLPGPGAANATPERLLDRGAVGGAQLSPDGRWLALSRGGRGEQRQVFIHPFPDVTAGRWAVSGPGGSHPRWRADGRELYFMDADRRLLAVSITTEPRLEIGVPQILFAAPTAFSNLGGYPYDVTPDGTTFLVTQRTDAESPAPLVVAIGWMR